MDKVCIGVLFFVCAFSVSVQANKHPPGVTELIGYADQCGVRDILKDGLPLDRKADGRIKCFTSCMAKKLEILTPGLKVNMENTHKIFDGLGLDPAKQKDANEKIESCGHITDEDECEMAYKIYKCLEKVWINI